MKEIKNRITYSEAKRMSLDYNYTLDDIYACIREAADKNADHIEYCTVLIREDILNTVVEQLKLDGFVAYISKSHEENPYSVLGHNIIVEWK